MEQLENLDLKLENLRLQQRGSSFVGHGESELSHISYPQVTFLKSLISFLSHDMSCIYISLSSSLYFYDTSLQNPSMSYNQQGDMGDSHELLQAQHTISNLQADIALLQSQSLTVDRYKEALFVLKRQIDQREQYANQQIKVLKHIYPLTHHLLRFKQTYTCFADQILQERDEASNQRIKVYPSGPCIEIFFILS